MDSIQVTVLAIVQGLTEFLPVSSSGHLILFPALFGWQDQGLSFDVAVHLGTLLAVLWVLRQRVFSLVQAVLGGIRRQPVDQQHWRMAWGLVLATVPVGLFGLLGKDWINEHLRSPWVLALSTAGFGVLLGLADWYARREKTMQQMGWGAMWWIGCAQALALIPGTSRSGVTMTMALLLGFSRSAAAEFSFLLSIPVIMLSGGLQTLELVQSDTAVDWSSLLLGLVLSALSAALCIRWFLNWVERTSLQWFVAYRLLLAMLIYWVLL